MQLPRIALTTRALRRPRLAILIWMVATIGVFVLGNAAGGISTRSAASEFEASGTEAARVRTLLRHAEAGGLSEEYTVVVSAAPRTVDDPQAKSALAAFLEELLTARLVDGTASRPALTDAVPPLQAAPGAGLVSADRTAVRIVGRIVGDGEARARAVEVLGAVIDSHRGAGQPLDIRVLSETVLTEEVSELVNSELDGTLRIILPLALLILLAAFRALVAAVIPLVLGITALLGAFGFVALYSQVVEPVSTYATQLVVLVGLAVAIDYSLFVISRYRSERAGGRDQRAAIEAALRTSGRSVIFSGLAVAISIAALFLLNEPIFSSMAIGTIAVVLVSVLGSATFLPAILTVLGDRVEWGRLPVRTRPRASLVGPLVGLALRRPAWLSVMAISTLLLVASPVTRLPLGQTDLAALPKGLGAVRAYELLREQWPAAAGITIELVAEGDRRAATRALQNLAAAAAERPGVGSPGPTRELADGVLSVSLPLDGRQNDRAGQDVVRAVRADLVPDSVEPGVTLLVGGAAATALDSTERYGRAIPVVFLFVLALSFGLLLLVFRSLWIAVISIGLNLLSAGAAYGVLVLVFAEGWLADILGTTPGVIEAWVPLFIFSILFGLSMDYHVFIVSRIKEVRDSGAATREAIRRGMSATAGTVTSAAAIMVAVFAVFATLQLVIVRQLGLGLAVAVVLDATLIRVVLVPALMALAGDANWWLPRWVSWLPDLRVEHPAPAPTVVDAAAREARR